MQIGRRNSIRSRQKPRVEITKRKCLWRERNMRVVQTIYSGGQKIEILRETSFDLEKELDKFKGGKSRWNKGGKQK